MKAKTTAYETKHLVYRFCRTYAKAHAKTKEIKEKKRFSNTYTYIADWRILIKANEERKKQNQRSGIAFEATSRETFL